MVYTSCITSYRTTEDLGPEEISEYQEDLKTSYNYNLVLGLAPKIEIFSILAKNSCKIEIELFW